MKKAAILICAMFVYFALLCVGGYVRQARAQTYNKSHVHKRADHVGAITSDQDIKTTKTASLATTTIQLENEAGDIYASGTITAAAFVGITVTSTNVFATDVFAKGSVYASGSMFASQSIEAGTDLASADDVLVGDDVRIISGNSLILDSSTDTALVNFNGTSIAFSLGTTAAGDVISSSGDVGAFDDVSAGDDVRLVTTGKVIFDSSTDSVYLDSSGATIAASVGFTVNGSVQALAGDVTASQNLRLPQSGRLYLDSGTDTAYVTYLGATTTISTPLTVIGGIETNGGDIYADGDVIAGGFVGAATSFQVNGTEFVDSARVFSFASGAVTNGATFGGGYDGGSGCDIQGDGDVLCTGDVTADDLSVDHAVISTASMTTFSGTWTDYTAPSLATVCAVGCTANDDIELGAGTKTVYLSPSNTIGIRAAVSGNEEFVRTDEGFYAESSNQRAAQFVNNTSTAATLKIDNNSANIGDILFDASGGADTGASFTIYGSGKTVIGAGGQIDDTGLQILQHDTSAYTLDVLNYETTGPKMRYYSGSVLVGGILSTEEYVSSELFARQVVTQTSVAAANSTAKFDFKVDAYNANTTSYIEDDTGLTIAGGTSTVTIGNGTNTWDLTVTDDATINDDLTVTDDTNMSGLLTIDSVGASTDLPLMSVAGNDVASGAFLVMHGGRIEVATDTTIAQSSPQDAISATIYYGGDTSATHYPMLLLETGWNPGDSYGAATIKTNSWTLDHDSVGYKMGSWEFYEYGAKHAEIAVSTMDPTGGDSAYMSMLVYSNGTEREGVAVDGDNRRVEIGTDTAPFDLHVTGSASASAYIASTLAGVSATADLGAGGNLVFTGGIMTDDNSAAPVYGEMYADNINETVVIGASGTAYEITNGFSTGTVQGTTVDGAHYIQVGATGTYKIDWSLSFDSGNGDTIEGGFMVDGSRQARGTSHGTNAGITEECIGGTAIIALNANQQVSLFVTNQTDTTSVVIDHGNLTVTLIDR